jgi:hypothetical protein
MSGHLKCPHCASIVEYGVMVCRGCGAEVAYISADALKIHAAILSQSQGLQP